MRCVAFQSTSVDDESLALASATISMLIAGCSFHLYACVDLVLGSVSEFCAASCGASRWTVRLSAPGVCQLLVGIACVVRL